MVSVPSVVYTFSPLALAIILGTTLTAPRVGPEGLCIPSSTSFLGNNASTGCFFSESYAEARSKFRLAAAEAGADLYTLPVVGDAFTTDIAVLNGTGSGLVVHSSGVHGVEGYAGSAIQIAYLHGKRASPESESPTVVLVHAVNPFGMAYMRRFNEHNIDLGRNALHEEEWRQVLARERNIAGYEDLKHVLSPPKPPTATRMWTIFTDMATLLVTLGRQVVKKALVAGQYHDEKGIFYGGTALEPSHRLLWSFLERFKDTTGKVTWVDVHTGLGPSGVDTLLGNPQDSAQEAEEAVREIKAHFPGARIDEMGGGDKAGDVAGGYDLTVGTTMGFYPRRFPLSEGGRPLVFCQEFGTQSNEFVARAMILENQAFNFAKEDQPRWSELTRDAFYVRTRAWKESVAGRGLAVLDQAIARSSSTTFLN